MTNEPEIVVHIRLPKETHKKLKSMAAKNVRTINGEIIVALQRYTTKDHTADQAQIDMEEDATRERFPDYKGTK